MKKAMILLAVALNLAACTGADSMNGFAVGICESTSSCTVRDTTPRYGSQQQRAVDDAIDGSQEPM